MGIRCDFSDLQRKLDEKEQKAKDAILKVFSSAGERAVERARNTKTYKDVTGNLTASIGYGVVRNGELLDYGGFGGGTGGQKGLSCLREVAPTVNAEIALIIVAGMDYAIYVERKGYVVLDGGTLEVDDDIRSQLERIEL